MATLKTAFFKGVRPLGTLLPCAWLGKSSKSTVLIPAYHTVSEEWLPHVSNLYQVKSPQNFIADLEFLLKHYEPISLPTFLQSLEEPGIISRPSFLLTFDDGLKEFYEVVAPILREKGVPAVNFLNSAFIDNQALFYRYKASLLIDRLNTFSTQQQRQLTEFLSSNGLEAKKPKKALLSINYHQQGLLDQLAEIMGVDFQTFLKEQQPYLTSDQIQRLQQEGFEFGAHSIDHPDYRQLNFQEQVRQTTQSMEAIATQFQLNYRAFAFPFTDDGLSLAFFQEVFDKQKALDLSFGGAGIKADSFPGNFQRIPMEVDGFTGAEVIKLEWGYYYFKKLIGSNTIKRPSDGN